jgi:hypothetical protein
MYLGAWITENMQLPPLGFVALCQVEHASLALRETIPQPARRVIELIKRSC